MKEYAKRFYKSKAWQQTRNAYISSVHGLCEECLRKGIYEPGEIVHHKQQLSSNNINDPDVTLSWDNLELLCRACHGKAHGNKRYKVDEFGKIIIR